MRVEIFTGRELTGAESRPRKGMYGDDASVLGVVVVIPPAEPDVVAVEGEQPVIGDGDANKTVEFAAPRSVSPAGYADSRFRHDSKVVLAKSSRVGLFPAAHDSILLATAMPRFSLVFVRVEVV